jgi:AAA15 family ATPase/GTPase
MLIGFSVTNFRSFHAQQSLSFISSSDDSHRQTHCISTGFRAVPTLNRTAVMFGPNASGKTNLFMALRRMRDLVLNSTVLTEEQYQEAFSPFGFSFTDGAPTEFEIDLLLEGDRYKYAISYDARRITYERLTVYSGRKPQRWFERSFDAETQSEMWAPFSVNVEGHREMWRKATRPRALFVTTAAQLDGEQFVPLLRWFQTQLEFVLSSADYFNASALTKRMRDTQFKNSILSVLQMIKIPIDDIRMIERADSGDGKQRSDPHLLDGVDRDGAVGGDASSAVEVSYAKRSAEPVWVNLANEGAGVRRLFFLLGPLLDTIHNSKLAVVDNFDAALHPLVSRFVLQLNSLKSGTRQQAQLLLSSHNTSLMDLDILRRDEIWLMDTDGNRASKLSSMAKHHLRRREMIAKHYLRGRYGGVPLIDAVE